MVGRLDLPPGEGWQASKHIYGLDIRPGVNPYDDTLTTVTPTPQNPFALSDRPKIAERHATCMRACHLKTFSTQFRRTEITVCLWVASGCLQ